MPKTKAFTRSMVDGSGTLEGETVFKLPRPMRCPDGPLSRSRQNSTLVRPP